MKKKLARRFTPGQILLCLLMVLIVLTMVVPLLNILARSLSEPSRSLGMSGMEIIPRGFSTLNYQVVFSNNLIVPALFNSIFITVVGTVINVLLTTTAAYVLTRPRLMFKKYIMGFLIVMMLFDPGLVPEYLVIQKFGLMNNHWSVILVSAVNVYYLVICMRYFEAVPNTLYETASMEGAGHPRIFAQIYLPLAKSGVATLSMFYAVVRWNEYFRPGIYLTSSSKTTLQVILRQFVVSGDTAAIIGAHNMLNYNEFAKIDYNALKSATIVIAIVPILLVYPLVLRFYAKDIMAGSVKE